MKKHKPQQKISINKEGFCSVCFNAGRWEAYQEIIDLLKEYISKCYIDDCPVCDRYEVLITRLEVMKEVKRRR
jgi:hypothetical protein